MSLRLLTVFILTLLSTYTVFAQCEVEASSSPIVSVCGDSVILSAFGQGQGQQVFNETFDGGSPTGWAFTQQADFSNPCSPGGVNGTTHIWMGANSGVPRALETVTYDFTSATAGVTVCFDMLFAEQGGTAPCEGPDEPDEGVSLQYSPNGGSTWIEIEYYDPNGGNDPDLVNWNTWCVQLPPGAIGPTTRIRWFQDNDSGADYDHWGIDNVEVYYNDPTYQLTWQHDGYAYPVGQSGGPNPNAVYPQTTTDYVVIMTNGTYSCADTVTVTVVPPTLEVEAGADTSICPGDCAVLNATAKVVKKPAKTPTYENSEVKEVVGTPAIPFINPVGEAELSMNINITDLNMTTILPNSITEVCLNLAMLPIPGSSIDGFRVRLICPSGGYIDLVPGNTTSGQLYNNTCFVPSGGAIPSSNSTYTGTYGPNQPFNDLVGCTANGVWTLEFYQNITTISLPVGFFYGWSISFDDPEISYTADVSWSPTTNMTGANTLTPTVCPTTSTTYTISATDTAGCVVVTDTVRVNVQTSCCNLEFNATSLDPTCGNNDGYIQLNIVSGSGNYSYLWGGGETSNSLSNLGAGTYTVTITDNGQPNCVKDTSFTLTTTNAPVIDSIVSTDELCAGAADGTVGVYASGGNGTLSYQWDDPNNSTTATVSNLAPGTYNVTVQDGLGCQVTSSVSVAVGPSCCNLQFQVSSIPPTCGASDGEITVNVTGAAGLLDIQWSNSATTNNPNNLAAGSYTVTVIDLGQPNCQKDTTINLSSIGAPVIDTIIATHVTCAGDADGSADLTVSGGSAPYTFLWSNNATSEDLSNLSAGTYSVTVTDATNCDAVGSVTIIEPTSLSMTAVVTQPSCNNNDGEIDATITGGTTPYAYQWQDPLGFIYTTEDISNLAPGTFNLTITDDNGCTFDTSFVLNAGSAPTVTASSVDESCLNFNNGSASATVTGGLAPYTYLWNTGDTTQSITVGGGTYIVTVTDAANCSDVDTAVVQPGPLCCQLNASAADEPSYCGNANGSITVNVDTGTGPPPYTYELLGVTPAGTSNNFTGLAAGLHTFVITDVNGCTDTMIGSVTEILNSMSMTIDANSPTCAEGSDGDAAAIVTGGTLPYTYSWDNGDTNFQATDLPVGQYSVLVTDANGCTLLDSTLLSTAPLVADLIQDAALCEGNTLTLDAGSASSYLWSTGETEQTISATDTGMYYVTITNADGCEIVDTAYLSFYPGFVVDAGLDTSIEFATSTDLEASLNVLDSTGTYSWSPEFFLSCNDCALTMASPDTTTLFYVTYTSDNGCMDTDSVLVTVLEEPYVAVMPSAFSPNGDGENDVLYLYHSGTKDVYWMIFDRWGEKVFETRDPDQGWDGTYKGKLLAPGTFVHHFVVQFKNGTSKRASGSTTLLR